MSYERRRPGTASGSRRPYYVIPSSRPHRRPSKDDYDDYENLEEPAPRKRHGKATYSMHRPAYPVVNYYAASSQVPQSPTEGYYESVEGPSKRYSAEFFRPDERRPVRTAAPPRLNVSYSESMARQSRARPLTQERLSRARRHVATSPEIQPISMEGPAPAATSYTEQIIIPEKEAETRVHTIETENEESDGGPRPYKRSMSSASWRDRSLSPERRQGANDDVVIVRPASPARDVDVFEQFNFVCNGTESSKSGNLSDLELPTPDKQSLVDDTEMTWATPVTKVHASQYKGDAEIGGHHSATLTVKHGLKGRNQPLFKWLHVQQDVMNFDEFWLEVSRELPLNETERSAVARLRASVKQRCVGSTYNPNGQKVGYIEPKMVEVSLEKPKYPQNDKQDANVPMVKWICIPYFALHEYSGLAAGTSSATFPSQTLLQMQYSRIPQQRDLDQAICQLGIAEKDECFHISQLWCVVIDNSILITCGEMAKSDLQGEAISFASELSPPTGSSTQRILVKYGDALTWTFPVSECRTWFAFISHFTAFWPSHLEFLHNGKTISPDEWSKLLRYVSKINSTTLELRVATYPEALPRNNLKAAAAADNSATTEPSSSKADKSKSPTLSASMAPKELEKESILNMTAEPLHVLPLANLAMVTETNPDIVVQDFDTQLKAAEEFITKEATYTTQLCYEACSTSTRDELIAKLAIQNIEVEDIKDDEEKRRYEERLEVANALDAIFQLFLPINCKGPTSGKYWGALVDILGFTRSDGSYDVYQFYVTRLKVLLRTTWADIQVFQNFMSHAAVEDRAKIEFPREFSGAWLHLLSGLVTCRANIPRWDDNIERAKKLLAAGMGKIIQGISSDNLLDHALVQPLEVVSLLALQLLQDQVGKSGDISETYSLFLNSLDTDITSKPIDRSNQHKLDLVKPEMRAVIRTLYKQRYVMTSLRKSLFSIDGFESFGRGDEDQAFRRKSRPAYDKAYYTENPFSKNFRTRNFDYSGFEDQNTEGLESASKLSPTNKYGFRNLFLTDCVRLIEQRDQEFRRFEEYVEELESAVAYKVESTKDRQENAVYAFTAISYIFLPLSAIAGIFGMNTSDVRDMEYRQWLYWTTAIPVTMLVIIGGLWWMNELGNVWRWLTGRGRQRPLSATITPTPEPYYINRPLSPEYEVVRPAPLTRLQQYVREPRNRTQVSRRRTRRQNSFSMSE